MAKGPEKVVPLQGWHAHCRGLMPLLCTRTNGKQTTGRQPRGLAHACHPCRGRIPFQLDQCIAHLCLLDLWDNASAIVLRHQPCKQYTCTM
eukprot:365199-Chlamydomonas_euryale.AAC.6